MSSIFTITFNPCIDKSTSVAFLEAEKKLKCAPPKMEPGGGGINVARAIKKLGGQATAIFPQGGYTGKFLIELLAGEGISSLAVEAGKETRENIIILDESENRQYRFGMPGTGLSVSEWKKMLELLDGCSDIDFIVASGSLQPGVPVDIFARIAVIAKRKNAKLVVDTCGPALWHAVEEGVYLLKPNLAELAFLAGKDFLDADQIQNTAKQLIERSGCKVVVVSLGSAGALMVTETSVRNYIPPAIPRKSTVGAGDSMVAGIVLSLSKGEDIETAVRFGVACGTAATMNPGTELCRREDAEKLFSLMNFPPVKKTSPEETPLPVSAGNKI